MTMIIRLLLAITRPFSKRLSVCALIGLLVGVITAAVLMLVWGHLGLTGLSMPEVLWIALILGLFGWLVSLLMLGGFLGYAVTPLLGATLVNALLTALLTVLLCNAVADFALFFVFGVVAGLLVGEILCRLCGDRTNFSRRLGHGAG